MKKAYMKIVAKILIAVLIMTIPVSRVNAATDQQEIAEETQYIDSIELENKDTETDNTENNNENQLINEDSEVINQNIDDNINADNKLNYLYIDKSEQESGEVQSFLVSWDDEEVSELYLVLEDEKGGQTTLSQVQKKDNVYLFENTFVKGIYHVAEIISVSKNEKKVYTAEELETNAFFGVGESCTEEEKSNHIEMQSIDSDVQENLGDETEISTSVVSIDENGNTTAQENLSEALDEAGATKKSTNSKRTRSRAKSNVVVVLDPGHDASHTGAYGNGVNEEVATLKIAKACKEELEQYADVTVYLTREGAACPYPEVGTGKGSNVTDIKKRVEWAKIKGANVFVSIHLNAVDNIPDANGAEVYYPSSSTEGKEIAQDILNKLVELGLHNRGVKNNYDDYAVIKNSTANGFPGLIVEHAFVSNTSDVSKYLNSDEKLKRLGVADAEGIAKYFGLVKGRSFSVRDKNDFEGKASIQVSGMGNGATLKITNENGTSKEYNLKAGTNIIDFTIADYNNARGTYSIVVTSSTGQTLYSDTFYISKDTSATIEATSSDKKEIKYSVKTKFADMPQEVSGLSVAVWSDKDGQDDLIWYPVTQSAFGEWTTEVDITKHRTAGKYEVNVYANLSDGSVRGIGSTDFEVTQPSMKAKIENYQEAEGTFDVVVDNINCPSGVNKINIPVWSKSDQSDICWYTAEKQQNGSYKVTVNIANHGYSTGTYIAHAYMYSENSITVAKVAGTQKVTLPQIAISAEDINHTEMQYLMKVQNAGLLGGVKNVMFATWSEKDGQDDLIWYSGSRNSAGEWTAVADITKHRTAGKYKVDVYAIMSDGNMRGIGSISFEVTQPSMKAEIENYQENQGTFDVVVKDIICPSGIKEINIPVWSKANQSDIHWYAAKQQSDGTYKVTVSIANHGYSVGTYTAHAYMYSKNGMVVGKVAGTQQVIMPKMTISAEDINHTEMQYLMKVQNAGLLGGVKNVMFATWSEKDGQDDLIWYSGSRNSAGEWTAVADITKHRTAGKYKVDVYAIMSDGSMKGLGETSFEVTNPQIGEIEVTTPDETTGQFTVTIKNVQSPSGISNMSLPVWCKSDQSDIRWYTAEKQKDGSYKVVVDPINHGYNSGLYKIHVYVTTNNGIFTNVGSSSVNVLTTNLYPIMGDSTVTVQQMVKWYKSKGNKYPSSIYSVRGAEDIEQFCEIYYEEAAAEGVRAEVAFAQAMKETGWLQFGGIVDANQCNFAGIGALDGNDKGKCASFNNVREGVRAQIQHLKAYASTETLDNSQVDPRFHLVTRGSAPYVEWLGIQENPNHVGWATGRNYGYNIVTMIKELKSK